MAKDNHLDNLLGCYKNNIIQKPSQALHYILAQQDAAYTCMQKFFNLHDKTDFLFRIFCEKVGDAYSSNVAATDAEKRDMRSFMDIIIKEEAQDDISLLKWLVLGTGIKEVFMHALQEAAPQMSAQERNHLYKDLPLFIESYPYRNLITALMFTIDEMEENQEKPRALVLPLTKKTLTKKDDILAALKKHIIGQDAALEAIVPPIARYLKGYKFGTGPIGRFCLVGQSGVGKTETPHAIAKVCFGGRIQVVKLNEFQESHSGSKIVGSPPGYVGYREKSELVQFLEANKDKGGVIVFDEMEKAHSKVLTTLLDIIDKGELTYNGMNTYCLNNFVIFFTSNVGADHFRSNRVRLGFNHSAYSKEDLRSAISSDMRAAGIPPEFENRLQIIMYNNLAREDVVSILKNKAEKLVRDIRSRYPQIDVLIDREVLDFAYSKAEKLSDGSPVRSATREIEEVLPDRISDEMDPEDEEYLVDIHVNVNEDKSDYKVQKTLLNPDDNGVTFN